MKKLNIALLAVLIFASCSSERSGNFKASETTVVEENLNYNGRCVPFRAHETWFSTVTYDRIVDNNIQIIYVDSAFRGGDTVRLSEYGDEFILQERVK